MLHHRIVWINGRFAQLGINVNRWKRRIDHRRLSIDHLGAMGAKEKEKKNRRSLFFKMRIKWRMKKLALPTNGNPLLAKLSGVVLNFLFTCHVNNWFTFDNLQLDFQFGIPISSRPGHKHPWIYIHTAFACFRRRKRITDPRRNPSSIYYPHGNQLMVKLYSD